MENYSKKADKKMDTFLRTITDTVGTKLHGMKSTIVKMKEEEDDRYRQINERITNMEPSPQTTSQEADVKTEANHTNLISVWQGQRHTHTRIHKHIQTPKH